MMKVLALIAVFVITTTAANAIDFSAIIQDDDGQAVQTCIKFDSQGKECQKVIDLTLGIASANALSMGEQGLSVEDSYKRGALASKVRNAKEFALPAEDISLIKKQLPKVYGPGVVFKAINILDPPEGKK